MPDLPIPTWIPQWCRVLTGRANIFLAAAMIPGDTPQNDSDDSKDCESCPSSDKGNWEKIKGSDQAYKPKKGKEPIFEKDRAGDRSHGDSAWKKWNKRKDWENGKDRDGTYDATGKRLRD